MKALTHGRWLLYSIYLQIIEPISSLRLCDWGTVGDVEVSGGGRVLNGLVFTGSRSMLCTELDTFFKCIVGVCYITAYY